MIVEQQKNSVIEGLIYAETKLELWSSYKISMQLGMQHLKLGCEGQLNVIGK